MKPITGIRKQLSLAFALIVLAIGAFAIEAAYMQREMAKSAALLEAKNVANAIAYTGNIDVITRPEFLQPYVEGLLSLYNRDVVIVDAQKRGIADADKGELGKIYTNDPGNEVGLTIRDGRIRIFVETNALHPDGAKQIVVALHYDQLKPESPIIGAVILEYTSILDSLLSEVRAAMYWNLIFGVVCILFAGALGFRVASRVAKPLEELQHGVQAIAGGNYDTTVQVRSNDEIGALGGAFNKMAVELKESHAKLSAYQSEQRAQSEKKLGESEERYRQLVELSPDAICIESGGNIVFANRACATLLGAGGSADIIGRPAINFIHPDSLEAVNQHRRQVKETKLQSALLEAKLIRLDGTAVDVEGVAGPFLYEGRLATQLVIREITARKEAAERLSYLAQYDSLTALPNRSLFRDRLERAIARARRGNNQLALMFLDLDRFKEINDSLGHTTGDEVLQAVARLFRESLRDVDTIARLGGDEFTIILDDIKGMGQVITVAERIRKMLSAPLLIHGAEVFVTTSIGIAIYPMNGESIEALTKAADAAMYRAKEEGRNTHAFFDSEMNAEAAKRLHMTNLLRHALERRELLLYYQPKVSIHGGKVTGAEALARWNSKELGFVPPGEFIPLAEETGLIGEIGEWVLRTACAQNKAWQVEGLAPLAVAVNLSARQFQQKDIVEMVAGVLAETGLEPRFLELEITESMIMRDAERTIIVLEKLNRLGVQLSIDDFGTGYSSLAYLKKFPVHTLKIDQSFVRDLALDADDASIVKAVIAMAKSLGLGVIAEGVETAEQLSFLAKLHCDEYQGYYFGKPAPAEQFVKMLRSRNPQVVAV